MGIELLRLTDRYANQIAGTLSCYDRIIIQGTVPKWCYARGMTEYCYAHQIRIFDYPQWAQPLREAIRKNAEQVAAENGIEVEFIRSKKKFRQEDRVKEISDKRGTQPGKCLHYYFYFIDEELGLCSARVPTWCPFRLQFYCNGHSYLARQMDKQQIEYQILDNAFGSPILRRRRSWPMSFELK